MQSVYDPYRLVSVLKRAPGTKRGENKWVTIDFDQAIESGFVRLTKKMRQLAGMDAKSA